MDTEISEIIKTRDIIRKKFNAFRHGEAETSIQLEKQFKPVTEPLKAILKVKAREQGPKNEPVHEPEQEELQEEQGEVNVPEELEAQAPDETARDELYEVLEKNYGPQVSAYLYDKLTSTTFAAKAYDETYGVRRDNDTNGWMIGNQQVSFDDDGKLKIDGSRYDPEPGFLELIFKKYPRGYTVQDLDRYREVLEMTSAHKRSYDNHQPVNSNRGPKYRDVIAKLYPPENKRRSKKRSSTGRGIPVPQKVTERVSAPPKVAEQVFVPQNPKERVFVYWDDPNELVERLALLNASKDAGHTGHDREILSIAEELREAGFIE